MLKPCVYNPQTGEFLEDGSAYPFFIITYLARNPQPIWLPFTKGNEMVVGDKSTSAKRKADELPRLIRNAFKEDDLNPETDYLNVLVVTGKGWEIWRVQAKYVTNPNITVLVPIATVDPNVPLPDFNLKAYTGYSSYYPYWDWYVSLLGNLPTINTSVVVGYSAIYPPQYVYVGLGAYDDHGYLEWRHPLPWYIDSVLSEVVIQSPDIVKIGNRVVCRAPSKHTGIPEGESNLRRSIFSAEGFYHTPYTVNGQILSPFISVLSLRLSFSYQPLKIKITWNSAEVIGWGDPVEYSTNWVTGIWNLPSDFSQHQVSGKYLLSQVGQRLETFVHPAFEPSLTIKKLNRHRVFFGYLFPWFYFNTCFLWSKIADDIWLFGLPLAGYGVQDTFRYIFKGTDDYPCSEAKPSPGSLPSGMLVRDPDLYGKIYIPPYPTPFSPTEYPFRQEATPSYQEWLNEMVECGVIDEPDLIYELKDGTLKPIFVSRYKVLSPTPPITHTLTLPIYESEFSLVTGSFTGQSRLVGYRTFTPQLRLASFNLPSNRAMMLCMSDIPFVYPEGMFFKVSDSGRGEDLRNTRKEGEIEDRGQGNEGLSRTMELRDEGIMAERMSAIVWQPVWLSHSLTSDPTYGDTLVQVGFKVVRWGSPARTEFAFSGLIAGSIWFMDVLRRLRNKQLRDADKVLLRDCICSVDGLFGLIRLTFHYDASSGLIYMREWRLGVPYGNIVPLITFSLRPYHEVRVLRDISAWSVFLDIIDTRTNTVEQRLRIVPRVGGWSVAPVSVSEPILFTHRKSIVNPLISVNPSSSYSIDRSLNLHHTVGRSAHALVTPHLSNINPLIYKGESYPLRFYPLQAPVARLSSLPSQYYRAAQKVYGANIPAYGVMFGNLNAQPIFVVTIPVIEELRSKKVEWFEEFWGKWSVGVAMFLAAPDWAQKLVQGVASLGTLIDWAVLELWEPEP